MSDPAELRVMTYNVRSLRDDLEAIGAVVRACAPDVLLVQEAPRFLRWRSKRAKLARVCGLVVATADRPGGLCIMTSLRVDIGSTSFSLLPKQSGRHQRAIVGATVTAGGQAWRVMTTHLSTDAAERQHHLPALHAALAAASDAPTILGGDLNEDPGGPVFTDLSGRLQDSFAVAGTGNGNTAPAMSPRRRIDAVLVDQSLTVVSCEAVGGPGVEAASDHRPVVATVRR
jgi:endonuclease/exonuclease/phosphatase family metal-dependent hydrolase